MIDEILPSVYRIEVPLPRNPLKALNSYVLKGPGRNLIVDTGFNREECRSAMLSGLEALSVDLRETDFFITHMHADHSGLVGTLATGTSRVFCSRKDAEIIVHGGPWEQMARYARLNGFPPEESRSAIERHPANRFGASAQHLELTLVEEGDSIAAGDYSFRCVSTPGHTRGHLCLYDAERRILVAGDHILDDITPNIAVWSDEVNALKEYLESLDRVYNLEIDVALPGHRRIITDCKGRIRELKHHHRVRADEVLSVLDGGEKSAYQVASKMTWDMSYDSFEQFPVAQKWFAVGEAIAHLRYLEDEGAIHRERMGKSIFFSR